MPDTEGRTPQTISDRDYDYVCLKCGDECEFGDGHDCTEALIA